MKLAYWMYAGPAHLGSLRIASSFKNVHAIMHAPLGDDYFNVMRSMLERERDFTPVTASIVDRHVLARGSQEKVVENITRKSHEEKPDLILVTPTCTSSILQEDLQNFVNRASLEAGIVDREFPDSALEMRENPTDVLLADVNHYRVNEIQAADRTLEQIVRFYLEKEKKKGSTFDKTSNPSVNILGIVSLGFHNVHDCRELKRMFNDLGVEVNEILPEGCSVHQLKNLPKAWLNIVPYREIGLMTAVYLEKEFDMPYVATTPMGVINTGNFLKQVLEKIKDLSLIARERGAFAARSSSFARAQSSPSRSESFADSEQELQNDWFRVLSERFETYISEQTQFFSQAAWFSRSIDCQNLTGKKAVVFGDATHAVHMTKVLSREMGIRVVCAGTYCKHDSDWFREQVLGFCDEVLITDDHSLVGEMITRLEPSAIFGTQMERHVGKKLDIPCGVISAPVHIQNFPLGYRPFLGYEGSNQIADLVYNSFTLGMEDHLLEIFNGHDVKTSGQTVKTQDSSHWSPEALEELGRVPGFVRGKVKRNVEKFATLHNCEQITLETMYAAKEAANA
jgi:light-independent protochlorophyllide reductase subunit B